MLFLVPLGSRVSCRRCRGLPRRSELCLCYPCLFVGKCAHLTSTAPHTRRRPQQRRPQAPLRQGFARFAFPPCQNLGWYETRVSVSLVRLSWGQGSLHQNPKLPRPSAGKCAKFTDQHPAGAPVVQPMVFMCPLSPSHFLGVIICLYLPEPLQVRGDRYADWERRRQLENLGDLQRDFEDKVRGGQPAAP